MSVFAHKADKSKFNLGNESDLSGIGDGTTFNAIKTLNQTKQTNLSTPIKTFHATGTTKINLSGYEGHFASILAIVNNDLYYPIQGTFIIAETPILAIASADDNGTLLSAYLTYENPTKLYLVKARIGATDYTSTTVIRINIY